VAFNVSKNKNTSQGTTKTIKRKMFDLISEMNLGESNFRQPVKMRLK